MASKKDDSSFAINLRYISALYNDASTWENDTDIKLPAKSKTTKASLIASTPIEEIAKLKATNASDMKKMSQFLSTLQQSFVKRANQFINKGLYSHAVQAVLNQEPSSLTPAEIIKKSTAGAQTEKEMNKALTSARNKMLREIVIYQKFFSDKTSSVRGAYDVMASQARRIFGTTQSGKIVYMPTQNEWRRYWALYNEYNNIYKTDNSNLYSGLVQQALAYVLQSNRADSENFVDILDAVHNEVHSRLDQENAEEYRSDWSDFEDADELPY